MAAEPERWRRNDLQIARNVADLPTRALQEWLRGVADALRAWAPTTIGWQRDTYDDAVYAAWQAATAHAAGDAEAIEAFQRQLHAVLSKYAPDHRPKLPTLAGDVVAVEPERLAECGRPLSARARAGARFHGSTEAARLGCDCPRRKKRAQRAARTVEM